MKQLNFYIGKSASLIASFVWKITGLSCLLLSLSSWGLAQNIQWEEVLGGRHLDIPESIVLTSDGGFAIAGYSNSSDGDVGGNNGEADYWVVKLDNTGSLEWEKNLGGSVWDQAASIIQTSDGGFAVAGHSRSSDGDVGGNNGNDDYWVVKLDNTGALQWEKHLGGSANDRAYDIVQTSDGGFAIAGYSNSSDGDVGGNNGFFDNWVVKLDNTGTLQWEKNLGGSADDRAHSIVRTSDGGFVIAGSSESSDGDVGGNNGNDDYWVVKLDNTGGLQWEKNLGGSNYDQARSIIQTSDGGFAIAGESSSSDGDVGGNNGLSDYWVVRLGNAGSIQWEKNFGGDTTDQASSIVQTLDDGFAIAGKSASSDGDVGGNNGGSDSWVLKLDNSGGIEWEKNLGGSDTDGASSIVQTSDSSFVIASRTESSDGDVGDYKRWQDYWVVKLNPNSGCTFLTSSISPSVCEAYEVPSGDTTYTQGGTYKDTLENVTPNGCDSIITINLTINDVDASATKSGQTLEANASGATYQWLDCDNSYAEVPGATSQSFTPSADGNYAVAVTQNNCTDTSSCYQVETTGIAANGEKGGFEVYPNPAADQLTIVQPEDAEPQTFQLQTLTGKRLKTGRLSGTERIDVSNRSPGVYLLEVRGEDAVRTKKVVVK